jgi:hypothetical protein
MAKNKFNINFMIDIKKLPIKILIKDNLSKQANSGYKLCTFIFSNVSELVYSNGL